jgi:hypothetical protein
MVGLLTSDIGPPSFLHHSLVSCILEHRRPKLSLGKKLGQSLSLTMMLRPWFSWDSDSSKLAKCFEGGFSIHTVYHPLGWQKHRVRGRMQCVQLEGLNFSFKPLTFHPFFPLLEIASSATHCLSSCISLPLSVSFLENLVYYYVLSILLSNSPDLTTLPNLHPHIV